MKPVVAWYLAFRAHVAERPANSRHKLRQQNSLGHNPYLGSWEASLEWRHKDLVLVSMGGQNDVLYRSTYLFQKSLAFPAQGQLDAYLLCPIIHQCIT